MKSSPYRLFLLLPLTLVLFAGCDSGDPIDDPGNSIAPVSGSYSVEVFSVVPDASVIPPLNLLDTLVQADTRLQLFEGGDFVLTYHYTGGPIAALLGTYTYTAREVRLRAQPSASDLHDWRSLLMTETLILQRVQDASDLLTTTLRKTVDMAALSDGYEGIPPLTATVQLRLREQGGEPVE